MQQNDDVKVPLGTVQDSDVHKINWSEVSVPIGARLARKEDEGGWLALSRDDWEVLHVLLTRNIGGSRAVDESTGLQHLARISTSVMAWYDRTKTVARPDNFEPYVERPYADK